MPYKQTKKLNKSFIVTVLFLALILSVMFWPVSGIIKIAGALVFFLIYIYVRRGYLYFSSAANLIKKTGPTEKVWSTLNKAVKSGISAEYQNVVALTMIQNGKIENGMEITNDVIEKNKEPHQTDIAKINLSVGYFAKKDADKAIEILKEVEEQGYSDNRTFELMAKYYLYKKDLQNAKKVITEAKKKDVNTDAMQDNFGWYYIESGEWKKAEDVYGDLLDNNPVFPDAYMHAAEVDIHFNRKENALENIDFALSKRFHSTDLYSEEKILDFREKILNK